MATFPALKPSSRTFTPGRHPHSEIPTLSGLQTRVRTSNVLLEQRLTFTFSALSESEMLSICSHYNGQQGRFFSFDIPNDILCGTVNPSDFTPTGYSWIYAERPSITDIGLQRYDVSVALITVPPEGASLNGAEFTVGVSLVTVPAMSETVTTSFVAGAGTGDIGGLNLTVTTSVAAGEATGGGGNTFTWQNPDTGNPPANSYRLYGTVFSGFARLSTTTSAGYKKDELLAGLTLGRSITVLAKGVTHTGTVSTAGSLTDAGTSTERIDVFFSVTPTFPDTALGDGPMTLTLL